jgi:hypothetical protein
MRLILRARSIELGFEVLYLREDTGDIVIITDKLIFSVIDIKLNVQKLRNRISKILSEEQSSLRNDISYIYTSI